jgi:hypothetical protein
LTAQPLLCSNSRIARLIGSGRPEELTSGDERLTGTLGAQHLQAATSTADQPLADIAEAHADIAKEPTPFGDGGKVSLVLPKIIRLPVTRRSLGLVWAAYQLGGLQCHIIVFATKFHATHGETVERRAV